MIKAVIFDLNGIFIQAPKLGKRLEKDFGVDNNVFLPKLGEVMQQVRKPKSKPAFSYWGSLLKEWKINFSEKEFWQYWFSAEKVSDKMVSLARKLREKKIKVFILSNNFKERSLYYEHYPWVHEAVDKIYFSWQTGFVKPDVRAWQNVLTENDLKPEECLYFDDQEKNINVAKSLEIKAFQFITEEELEKTLSEYLSF